MPKVTDKTDYLLGDTYGPGEYVARVHKTKGAAKLTPTLRKFFDAWRTKYDHSGGFISNFLAYSGAMRGGAHSKTYHANMIRLVKGGHIRVCQVEGSPPQGSIAHRDSPYGEAYYILRAGSCPIDVPDGTLAGVARGGRRRR
jgi:hypothetical protein